MMQDFWPQNLGEAVRVIGQILSAALMAALAVWRLIRVYVKTKVEAERGERILADSRIEEKLRHNNDNVHVNMGKIEMMDMRIQELDRKRVEDSYQLKMTLQAGLHEIKLELEKLRRI